MDRYRRCLLLSVLALGSGLAGLPAPAAAPITKDSIRTVTYDQLGQMVRKLRGKVVVVDFWNIY
jgi:hypothetical protein